MTHKKYVNGKSFINDQRMQRESIQFEQRQISDIVCAKFGCGKHLSYQQAMYGKYCFQHQLEFNQNQNEIK